VDHAPKYGIPQEGLKLLACGTMLIDHIGAVFFPYIRLLRIIGRLSFPIYCFLLAEGVHYTRSPLKYGLRLLLVALIAEFPFDLLFCGQFTWTRNSVMVTLLLGFLLGVCMKKLPLWGKFLIVIPFAALARFARGDYGMDGLLMISIFLLTRDFPRFPRILAQSAALILLSLRMAGFPARLGVQFYAIAAVLPLSLYSGEKCSRSKMLQWGFTLFYPLHIVILLLIRGI